MDIFPVNSDLALLVLRLALGVVFLAHGPMKTTQTKAVAAGLGLSPRSVVTLGIAEALGALSMIVGILSQLGAAAFVVIMLGAIYFKTAKWNKNFTGDNGWEFEFVLLAAALAIFFAGSGSYTLF